MNQQEQVRSSSSIFSPTEYVANVLSRLEDSVRSFQSDPSVENFAKIVSVVGLYGASGLKLAREGSGYIRRYPVRFAVGLGVLALAVRGLMNMPAEKIESSSRAQTYH